jgi:uncharacterized membrane protein
MALLTHNPPHKGRWTARPFLLGGLFILYFGAGVLHLHAPQSFDLIMPSWVPWPFLVIKLSGIFEIAAAIALLLRPTRTIAGAALAAYAILVFPANVIHAWYHIDVPGLPSSWWYHAPRLLLQPVLVWMALAVADLV